MNTLHGTPILVLDFGSQYTQLIARRIREAGVYSELHPCDMTMADIKALNPAGIILSGGPESTTATDAPTLDPGLFELGIPLLGICYGMQAMASACGGQVESSPQREFGHAVVRARGHSRLLQDIEDFATEEGFGMLNVWMSHGDKVSQLPPGFQRIASSDNAEIAGMAREDKNWYALQFHPEVTHTAQGQCILQRFIGDICGCPADWNTGNIIDQRVQELRDQIGDDEVLLGLSGGVDSSVVAMLLHRAIGDRLTCIFVDNGLLRLHEAQEVMATFKQHLGMRVVHVEAGELFYKALSGIKDPEEKRKRIGHAFIEVFEQQMTHFPQAKWLAQGTIYPDVIESAGAKTGKAKVIKSHHNVGGLPDSMQLKLVEPLRDLFKDEVRQIGLQMGLPAEMIQRHPFPGPGLGVRILGEVKAEYADLLRRADAIFMAELRAADLYHKVSQAFTVFLPVKSVGVMGDGRCYDYVVALRAVETIDFMTARWAHLPYDFLERVSNRIINEVNGISRVCYDISGKPPATIEWE